MFLSTANNGISSSWFYQWYFIMYALYINVGKNSAFQLCRWSIWTYEGTMPPPRKLSQQVINFFATSYSISVKLIFTLWRQHVFIVLTNRLIHFISKKYFTEKIISIFSSRKCTTLFVVWYELCSVSVWSYINVWGLCCQPFIQDFTLRRPFHCYIICKVSSNY